MIRILRTWAKYQLFKYNQQSVKVFIKSVVFEMETVTFWYKTCLNNITNENLLL